MKQSAYRERSVSVGVRNPFLVFFTFLQGSLGFSCPSLSLGVLHVCEYEMRDQLTVGTRHPLSREDRG